jgi:murein L,D-transpeptidase YcbB/YkuD
MWKRAFCAALLCTSLPGVAAAAAPAGLPAGLEAAGITAAGINTPAYPARGRYVLVDAASARLFMVEDGEVRDSMRVIVGKPATQTPMIASRIYYATLNPYWNVPADLAQRLIAPRVLAQGIKYITAHNYEVLDGFGDDAQKMSPAKVDWKAVAAGTVKVRLRQRPGPANSMGRVKFWFPNSSGVFLHDSPEKELFTQDQRQLSNGCIRLEDAPRLARWLMGRDPTADSDAPEQTVLLPQAMPIYVTYLNNAADPGAVALTAGGGATEVASR